jgi:hypothetical protein
MPLDMTITATTGPRTVEVPEDRAADLQDAFLALSELPVNRQVNVDFPDAKSAREFVRQGKAWAASQTTLDGDPLPLVFARKGDIKGNPTRVSFRIYVPKK